MIFTGSGKIRSFVVSMPWDKNARLGVLSDIWFYSALGDSECSAVNVKSFKWTGSLPCAVEKRHGEFCLIGVCKDGGPRLIDPKGKVELRSVRPNPFDDKAEIELFVIEKGRTKLRVLSTLGETVAVVVDASLPEGAHTIGFDAGALSSGSYLLVLETPTVIKTYKLQLIR
jgi:hypothetical protein